MTANYVLAAAYAVTGMIFVVDLLWLHWRRWWLPTIGVIWATTAIVGAISIIDKVLS